MKTLISVLVLFAGSAAVPAQAATVSEVWVSPSGNDSAAGTQQQPLKTPQAGVDRLTAGGTVHLLPGTFTKQRVVIDHRSDLVIEGVAGSTFFDETGLTPGDDDTGVVQIQDSSRITVTGLDISGYRTTSLKKVPIGIYVTGSGDDISVTDNHVHTLGNDNGTRKSFDINAHGIAVYGRDAAHPISNLSIEGNEVDHLVLGASEAVVVNGNVTDWSISHNNIHDVNNIGIDAIGYEDTITGTGRYTEANRARHGHITGNTVDGVVSKGNPSYWEGGGWCNCADGIYVDGGTDIDIDQNTVRRADIGLEVGAEDPKGHTNGVRVTGNDVASSAYVGLALGAYNANRGTAYDITVSGNTFVGNNTLNDGSPEILLQYRLHQAQIVENHVTVGHPSTPLALKRVSLDPTTADNAGVVLDRNDYGGNVAATKARFAWLGQRITGFGAYQSTSHQDASSTWTQRP